MVYARFAPMISAASERSAIWRIVAVTVSALGLLFVWLGAIALVLSLVEDVSFETALRAIAGGDPATSSGAIIYFMIVGVLGLATLLAVRFWHRRGALSLIGPGARTLRHFVVAGAVTLGVVAILTIIPTARDETTVRNLDVGVWLMWLPFALIAVAAQTGAEELFFRGYLQSQIAARFRSPLVWLIVPALAFAAAHYSPVFPTATALTYMAYAALFGVLAGDLTARTGSIGAAWGFHFANNAVAVTIIAVDGTITGLGLFRSTSGLAELSVLSPWVLADLGALVLVWWCIRRVLD